MPQGTEARQQAWPGIDFYRVQSIWRDAGRHAVVLKRFAVDYGDACTRILSALTEDRPAEAQALAHKMKGTAANLGLNDLSHRAADVEYAIRVGAPWTNLMDPLHDSLELCLRSIDSFTASLPGAAAPTQPAATETAALDVTLNALLKALDGDNPDGAEPLVAVLATLIPDEQASRITRLLEEFDFRGAEALVREINDARTTIPPGEERQA